MKQIIKLVSLFTLAAPLLFSCNNNDQKILDQANAYLNEAKESIHSCHDAVVLLGNKFTSNYTLSSGSEFVFDISSKQMVVVKDNKIIKTSKGYTKSDNVYDYFKFVNVYDPNMQCSQYLKKSGIEMETIYVTTGFDAGYHKDIKNVFYSNVSGISRKVSINAYFDYLTIDAPLDEVSVYNETNNTIINEVSTLNMYGSAAYMKARSGNINFCGGIENAATRMFEIEEGCNDKVKPQIVNNGIVNSTLNCDTKLGGATALTKQVVNTATDITDNLTTGTADYFKLNDDIKFIDENRSQSLCFNRGVCIDLNGHKLTISKSKDEKLFNEEANSYEGLRIQSSDTEDRSLYIIDSQDHLDPNSGVDLINCSIIVAAPAKNDKHIKSNVVFNSGIVTQTVDSKDDITKIGPAIVVLGTTKEDNEKEGATTQIYGGEVICKNETGELNHCGCFGALGKGAVINIDYGDIESNDYCIFGNSLSNYKYGDAQLIISGGKVTSTDNCCIYFPLSCGITLNDCTLNGMTCINANSGEINISGSKLYSTGQYLIYTGKNYDGSVIYAPKYKNDSGDLTINVTNSTMNSSFAYILDVTGEEFTSKTTANFNSGTFGYYRLEGVYSDDSEAIINKGGTWTKRSS